VGELDLLKKIPKEHYTLYKGKIIRVGDLLRLLSEKNKNKKSDREKSN
jgi:hypothetical protein